MFLLTVWKDEQTILKLIVEDSNSVVLGFLLFHMCGAQPVSLQPVGYVGAAAAKYSKVKTHCLEELVSSNVDMDVI